MTKNGAGKGVLTKGLLFLYILCAHYAAVAKEGMWIPATLKAREQDMKAMGLKIPIEELYNENGTGLNNAVVLFGKGCTSEIISPEGLVLTNHHCGYGTVQGLSSTDKDYFANGFFCREQEGRATLPRPDSDLYTPDGKCDGPGTDRHK